MTRFIFCLTLLFALQSNVYSQVGIGTTTPNATSILDMTSTTQGVLTPRMTTVQRLAITGPAKGLLVFDNDLKVFYFFDGVAWIALEGGIKRNNYKLIKSAADLAAELTAGGGTKYLLSTNTLYEINGTITLAVPIELNNAYVTGRDTNEDILYRAGGTIFLGTKGGSIKGVTLSAPGGGTVFSLNGSVTENLIFRDCIVANSSSVGSISNFGVVFFSIIQFVNNTNGIIYTNINQLLLKDEGWDASNGGTYEKFVGTFDIITKQGGFSKVTSATAGIDVNSLSIVIIGGAGMNGVDFSGGGNYITGLSPAPYIGYKFTRDWEINCPGIRLETDANATGNLYLPTVATTSFSAMNTPIKIVGATTSINLFRTKSLTSNRLTYDGKKTRYFTYTGSMSVASANPSNQDVYNYYVYKWIALTNSLIQLPESKQTRKIGNGGDVGSISISGVVELAPNDYLELWVSNTTGTTGIKVEAMNFIMR